MATMKQQPDAELEARLRDKSFEAWLAPEEIAEIRAIIGGAWSQEASDRLTQLGADICAYVIAHSVRERERDLLRALGSACAKRRRAALWAHAAALGLWPHELQQRLDGRA